MIFKRLPDRALSTRRAFTLLEVLLALAISGVGLALLLQSLSQQWTSLEQMPGRYQALLNGVTILEDSLDRGKLAEENYLDEEGWGYELTVMPALGDARVQQVQVEYHLKSGERASARAYTLKVKRSQ